jgi:hypothetical protein
VCGDEEGRREGRGGADMRDRATRERGSAQAADLGQGDCWAAGKREKRKEKKWAAQEKKQAQEGGGGEGQAGLRAGLADFSFYLSFSSFLFQTNSILFEFK